MRVLSLLLNEQAERRAGTRCAFGSPTASMSVRAVRQYQRIAIGLDPRTLRAWGSVELLENAPGGARNEVWFALVNGKRCVIRRSMRSREALTWELDVVDAVRAVGLGAPVVIRAISGERSVDGVVVTQVIDGDRPRSGDDWLAVARYLSDLHAAFPSPQQRPGFLSACDLLVATRGGDVDLSAMPTEAVERCRSAWARLCDQQLSLVHGDPGERNILITDGGVVLIDWDESRVDVPLFDLAALPDDVSPLAGRQRWLAAQAASAWEAAVSWRAEPEYARRRLAEVVG